jgi:amidophosphoribosyltransferase
MSRLLYQGVKGVEDISQSLMPNADKTFPRGLKPKEHSAAAHGTAKAMPFQDDKLREECGVMAVYGHPDAARQVYLGLYALQHRGQESAGIATANGYNLSNIKGMGLVSEIFTEDVLRKLPGDLAIGHTRYSTTGDSALLNAQPIRVDSTKGPDCDCAQRQPGESWQSAHQKLERAGAYFQTTSDSEIIVQLIAHSKAPSLVDAIADSLGQVEGAFSIVMMTRDRSSLPAIRAAFVRCRWAASRTPEAPTRSSSPRKPAPSTCCALSTSATWRLANW